MTVFKDIRLKLLRRKTSAVIHAILWLDESQGSKFIGLGREKRRKVVAVVLTSFDFLPSSTHL